MLWSAIANFIKWLFVPEAVWMAEQIASMNAMMDKKLGLFYWLYNTLRNFIACFSNLQAYSGIRLNTPEGTTVLFYGEFWNMATGYIRPLLTGLFVIGICVFLIHKVTGMFER